MRSFDGSTRDGANRVLVIQHQAATTFKLIAAILTSAPRGEELHLRGPGVQVRAHRLQKDPRQGARGHLLQSGRQRAGAAQH